mmetsp:Transcript_40215/g.124267  ORF Transcript_40215/g.124267 Transcript_40215/m.124267 type:complete len:287 (-) Transcript_40215:452-1312(-)
MLGRPRNCRLIVPAHTLSTSYGMRDAMNMPVPSAGSDLPPRSILLPSIFTMDSLTFSRQKLGAHTTGFLRCSAATSTKRWRSAHVGKMRSIGWGLLKKSSLRFSGFEMCRSTRYRFADCSAKDCVPPVEQLRNSRLKKSISKRRSFLPLRIESALYLTTLNWPLRYLLFSLSMSLRSLSSVRPSALRSTWPGPSCSHVRGTRHTAHTAASMTLLTKVHLVHVHDAVSTAACSVSCASPSSLSSVTPSSAYASSSPSAYSPYPCASRSRPPSPSGCSSPSAAAPSTA